MLSKFLQSTKYHLKDDEVKSTWCFDSTGYMEMGKPSLAMTLSQNEIFQMSTKNIWAHEQAGMNAAKGYF